MYAIFQTYQGLAWGIAVFLPVLAGIVFATVKFVKWAWYR